VNTVTRSNTAAGAGVGAARGSAGPARRWAYLRDEIRRDGWSWPEDDLEPTTRAGRFVSSVVPGLFLVYLAEPIRQVFGAPHPTAIRVLVPAVVAVYAATYMYAVLAERRTSHLTRVAMFAVMTACGVTFAAILGPDDLVYMTYVISMALLQLPPSWG
jgi:hypothetical protein